MFVSDVEVELNTFVYMNSFSFMTLLLLNSSANGRSAISDSHDQLTLSEYVLSIKQDSVTFELYSKTRLYVFPAVSTSLSRSSSEEAIRLSLIDSKLSSYIGATLIGSMMSSSGFKKS